MNTDQTHAAAQTGKPTLPLLSICIPTYNRSGFLRQTLDSVLVTLSRVSAKCELLVCDNASPDDTQAVLEEFRSRWPALKIFRNPENIGELNFYTAIQHATGKYVWLLGDDDLVEPGFLPAVINRLAEDPELVVCNHSIHSVDFSIKYHHAFHSLHAPESFSDRNDVLAEFGAGLSFISAGIVSRERITAIPLEIFERFSAHGLSFFTAVCSSLDRACRVAFIREPLLRYRGGNAVASDATWELIFVEGVGVALKHLAAIGYSSGAIRKAKGRAVRQYLIPRISEFKKRGKSTSALMSRAALVFSVSPLFHLLAVPLSKLPGKVFPFLRWLRRRAS